MTVFVFYLFYVFVCFISSIIYTIGVKNINLQIKKTLKKHVFHFYKKTLKEHA